MQVVLKGGKFDWENNTATVTVHVYNNGDGFDLSFPISPQATSVDQILSEATNVIQKLGGVFQSCVVESPLNKT